MLDRAARRRARSGASRRGRNDRRRHPLPDRRNRRSPRSSPTRSPAICRARRRRAPHRHAHRGIDIESGQHRARSNRRGRLHGRRLCPRARLVEPASRAHDRHSPADLSGQGLFADDPRSAIIARRPTIAAIDEHNLVAISRFGERIRVTATAEFAGYDTAHRPSDFAFMMSVTQRLYPRRRRLRPRRDVGGPPPDDAVQSSHPRPQPLSATSSSTPATGISAGPCRTAPPASPPT